MKKECPYLLIIEAGADLFNKHTNIDPVGIDQVHRKSGVESEKICGALPNIPIV